MIPSSMRGGTLTAKQRLKREKAMYDSGIALSEDSMLFKQRGGAELGHEGKPLVSEKTQLPEKGTAAASSGSDTEENFDENTTGSALKPDMPTDLPCRAPPISVTFGKRKKVEKPQDPSSSSPHVREEGDEVACLATAPASLQLTEEQQQAVAEAREKLVAAGEMSSALQFLYHWDPTATHWPSSASYYGNSS